MKFFLSDLKEKTSIDLTYDYTAQIEKVDDIIRIKPAFIKGDLVYEDDRVLAHINVDVMLELACAITLKPVSHHLVFDADIIFGLDTNSDFLLENPLDLKDVIFGYIVSEKPYKVVHEEADPKAYEEERTINQAFAELADLIKK
jgi:uncharacterized metal-binding protein YceD (DUF177 family)